ncbi:MAG TPA: hypothetical protein VEX43_19435 [Chthoniobacterales bacterium]|nr:hypothetical protein [Chthoniobacterales bacterium]
MNLLRVWNDRGGGGGPRRDRFLVALICAVVFVRVVYVLSYPLIIEGDGETYYALLLESRAHLLHATGYVFFSLPILLLANLLGTEPANLLGYFQHALSAAAVTVLYLALKRIVPRWISFLICLPLGIDAQLVAAAGTTRPEFLQADILILVISSAVFGLTSASQRAKTLFYLGAGVLGVAGYLTKYNFLPALAFCLVPLFDGELQWKSRFWMLGKACLGGMVLFVVFIATFHYPTTGSFQLNLEHGWIHILKLKEADIPLLPTNGIATQKYIVLSDSLPAMGAGPGPWKKIDEVPDAVRAPFRQKWSALLATNDAGSVREALAASEKGGTAYHHPNSFMPIYYYLGLKEGEKLLRAVFLEGVRGYSGRYFSNVRKSLIQSAVFSNVYLPYQPIPGVYQPSPLFKWARPPFLSARAGFYKAVDWAVATPEQLATLADQIWYPGARLFSFLSFIKYIPTSCLWIVMLAGFVLLPVFVARHRRLRLAETLFILVALALFGEMIFAAALFVFRSKELVLCQPLIYLMMGLSLSLWVEFISTSRRSTEQIGQSGGEAKSADI